MKTKIILCTLVFILNQSFAFAQMADEVDQFNQQMTNVESLNQQDIIDQNESGGDTNQSIDFEQMNPDELSQQSEIQNSDELDIAGSVGKTNLQDFVSAQTKNKGQWASQFIFISRSGQRTVLSSLNANTSIKPASTLKLFTGYLAFVEQSYPLTDLSSLLHRSDNVMADAALRSVAIKNGVTSNSKSETLGAGVELMKEFYKNLEDSSKFHPVNGSGLNTTGVDLGEALNKSTVRNETNLLEKIIKEKNYDQFKKLLAQPGQYGTLNYHLGSVSKLGHVYAKTGTLAQTKALAGYVETKNGVLVFSVIADQLKISPVNAFSVIEKIVLKHTQAIATLK